MEQGHADLHYVLNSILNLLPSARYATASWPQWFRDDHQWGFHFRGAKCPCLGGWSWVWCKALHCRCRTIHLLCRRIILISEKCHVPHPVEHWWHCDHAPAPTPCCLLLCHFFQDVSPVGTLNSKEICTPSDTNMKLFLLELEDYFRKCFASPEMNLKVHVLSFQFHLLTYKVWLEIRCACMSNNAFSRLPIKAGMKWNTT